MLWLMGMEPIINRTVLMSGADYFDDEQPINPFMTQDEPINVSLAKKEHQTVRETLESVGVIIKTVAPPTGCQDGVYTANWALVRGNKAVMARLPNARKAEEAYATDALKKLGKNIVTVPENLRFSGQGDALPCGDYLFAGSQYRTDKEVHKFLADELGYQVISLQTVPLLDKQSKPVINRSSGWPDSFFYDIDLAISVLREDLFAWCPEAFLPESQDWITALPHKKIEVSLDEATKGFACNLVSTGKSVVMSADAPCLESAIISHGLQVIKPRIHELKKGGGYIRCITLTLDN